MNINKKSYMIFVDIVGQKNINGRKSYQFQREAEARQIIF